jgi:aryl-alcohol dehydrogenase-like predicted oxidoreductase
MKFVRISNTDLEVSTLGMGTVWLGTKQDKHTSFNLLDQYYDAGGRYIDTANIYASWLSDDLLGGESETVVGQWLKDRGNRQDIKIETKLGFPYPKVSAGLTAKQIEEECEKSLKRLQTDYIDLYFAHVDDFNTPYEETMEAFDRLVTAGKVRHIAASNFMAWRLAEANMVSKQNGWVQYSALQQRHTYLRPKHDNTNWGQQIWLKPEMIDYCRTNDITMLAYTTTIYGTYSGREDRPIPPEYLTPDTDERMKMLHQIVKETGATAIQVVLAWMLHSDPIVVPIIGGSTKEQLAENLGVLNVSLTPDQMKRLNSAGDINL